jgi:hypothetical protein
VGIGRGHADAQHAGRHQLLPACLALRVDELPERFAATLKIGAPRVGQTNAPGCPDEKPQAHPLLEARHRTAHRGRRDTRSRGGGSEAREFRCQAKQLDAAKKQIVEMSFAIHYITYQMFSINVYLSMKNA